MKEGTPMRYIPHSTSYCEDTMLSENGEPTEKYNLCKAVLDEYLGKKTFPVSYKKETQSLTVELTESAELFDNLGCSKLKLSCKLTYSNFITDGYNNCTL